ncbi:MAG: hypothetical protein FJ293_02480 [Planctomycetes bacterium]|nr:hypothetical protein [Planctomycetota bacterium]
MTGIAELGASASTGSSTSKSPVGDLMGTDDFFTLLTAQLRAQDPLNPVDDAQFQSQLAQYSQLEASTKTNDLLATSVVLQESLAALQQMTQSASLIGKAVDYVDPYTGAQATGTVHAIRVVDGLVTLDVGGAAVPLPNLVSIREQE